LSSRTASLYVVLAALLFSTSGLLIKVIAVSPLALAGIRSLLAAGVIALWLGRPHFTGSLPQVGGAVALAATQLLFVLATRQTSAANAIFLQYTAPVFVALFGIRFLKEATKPVDWGTMLAVIVGLYLFSTEELTTQGRWGNINALLSGLTYAWFYLFMRKQKDQSTLETLLLGNLLAGLVGLPFLFLEPAWPSATAWAGLIFLGVLQLGLPFILLAMAIKRLAAVEAILIQTLEPILNPIWVFVVIGEAPTGLALLGGLLVLGAVTLRALLISFRRPPWPAGPPLAPEPPGS
jgi:drug/metabolite transporter (DMT)-like permease